jgi:uncharacterized membrane protein
MNRPKLKIKLTTVDYIIEIIGFIGIICLIALPIYYFNDLPDRLPTHFSALGQADSYGNKNMIWLLPALGLILYIGMTILNKYPHVFNYPIKVTNENAERLYKSGTITVRFLKIVVILSFAYLNFRIIKIGLNEIAGIGKLFVPIFLALIFGSIGIMISRMMKNKSRKHNRIDG